MQYFKGDATEKKFEACIKPILDALGLQLNDFYNEAYTSKVWGDLLWNEARAPFSKAIKQSVFRETYPELFDSFRFAGTFEAYISVFKKIFGDDVGITFNADNLTGGGDPPGPGVLNIDIIADGFESSNFIARHIEDVTYVNDNVVYEDGDGTDNIIFLTVKGFTSQYELEQMLREMVPAGIFTNITLTT